MNILYLFADSQLEWNCSEWRCLIPYRAINASGLARAEVCSLDAWASGKEEAARLAEWADLLVVQRNAFSRALVELECWRARGKTVVIDLDDAYHHMPPEVASYKFWRIGEITKPDGQRVQLSHIPLEQLEWGVKLANAVTSPSQKLLDDWRERFGVPGYLVPNYLEAGTYAVEHTPARPLVIGWGGSATHFASFHDSGCVTALRRVAEKRPVVVKICGAGYPIYRDLRLPPRQIEQVEWVDFTRWPALLASFDIGIAPLSGPYDERRSWIKGLEYSYLGIPWVASEGAPYRELFSQGYGIGVQNRPRAWEEALLEVIDHYDGLFAHLQAGPRARDLIWDAHVGELIQLYQRLIDANHDTALVSAPVGLSA